MTRLKGRIIKRGQLFRCVPHFHEWHSLDRKETTVVLKETKWGRQTTKMSSFRCLRCGREELEETIGRFNNGPADRLWKAKPTAEDTTKELFDVPK